MKLKTRLVILSIGFFILSYTVLSAIFYFIENGSPIKKSTTLNSSLWLAKKGQAYTIFDYEVGYYKAVTLNGAEVVGTKIYIQLGGKSILATKFIMLILSISAFLAITLIFLKREILKKRQD